MSTISQILFVPSNKRKVGNGRRNGFCFTITQIVYLEACIVGDVMQPPCENNNTNEIISLRDVPSPDLSVASFAARFRRNYNCIGLSYLQ